MTDNSERPWPALSQVVDRLRAAGCVFAEDEAALLIEAAGSPDLLTASVRRRTEGEPLEAILGWVGFCGLRLMVAPGVFVPRQRTAALVDQAVALARTGDRVLDLCCGVGAIGVAVADRVPGLILIAADVDPAAVACARVNLAACPDLTNGLVVCGDLFDPVPSEYVGRLDLITVNAPYVPTAAIALMPPEARDHEPNVALDGGADGLDVHRRVFSRARRWLAPGGSLLIEASERQAPVSAGLATAVGLTARIWRDDERDATVVIAVRR